MIFIRGDSISGQIMMRVFQDFSVATCQKVNLAKCRIYFGEVSGENQGKILEETHFTTGKLPFKYLRVHLDSRKLTSHHYRPLIDRMVAKVQH